MPDLSNTRIKSWPCNPFKNTWKFTYMTISSDKPLSRKDVKRLKEFRMLPNLTKIPLFVGIMVFLTWVAWTTDSGFGKWAAYIAIGYMWMGIVTFIHDGGHNTLFKARWANWAFGIVFMIPILITFISFKEDHLEHHRYNRSNADPDAFTMGKRGILDFVLFYAYIIVGGVLSFVHFNLLYPIKRFNLKQWSIHLFEIALTIACCWALVAWASHNGVLAKTLEVWLIPVYIFTLFNSVRFIAEHYETPWNEGQLMGSRTIISNPVNNFFWNNINWHIGHHVYPAIPWYNLVELHGLMKPAIEAKGAIVDKSYTAVFLKALLRGPETKERLKLALDERRNRFNRPAPSLG